VDFIGLGEEVDRLPRVAGLQRETSFDDLSVCLLLSGDVRTEFLGDRLGTGSGAGLGEDPRR
jgi:hypothetical protein